MERLKMKGLKQLNEILNGKTRKTGAELTKDVKANQVS